MGWLLPSAMQVWQTFGAGAAAVLYCAVFGKQTPRGTRFHGLVTCNASDQVLPRYSQCRAWYSDLVLLLGGFTVFCIISKYQVLSTVSFDPCSQRETRLRLPSTQNASKSKKVKAILPPPCLQQTLCNKIVSYSSCVLSSIYLPLADFLLSVRAMIWTANKIVSVGYHVDQTISVSLRPVASTLFQNWYVHLSEGPCKGKNRILRRV